MQFQGSCAAHRSLQLHREQLFSIHFHSLLLSFLIIASPCPMVLPEFSLPYLHPCADESKKYSSHIELASKWVLHALTLYRGVLKARNLNDALSQSPKLERAKIEVISK